MEEKTLTCERYTDLVDWNTKNGAVSKGIWKEKTDSHTPRPWKFSCPTTIVEFLRKLLFRKTTGHKSHCNTWTSLTSLPQPIALASSTSSVLLLITTEKTDSVSVTNLKKGIDIGYDCSIGQKPEKLRKSCRCSRMHAYVYCELPAPVSLWLLHECQHRNMSWVHTTRYLWRYTCIYYEKKRKKTQHKWH